MTNTMNTLPTTTETKMREVAKQLEVAYWATQKQLQTEGMTRQEQRNLITYNAEVAKAMLDAQKVLGAIQNLERLTKA